MAKRCVVIGAANADIGARSGGPLLMRDSNPGQVRISLGGVGRNIAHNLCLLGADTGLITALGGDAHASLLRESCSRLGIGLEGALCFPEQSSSSYVFIAGPDGEMELAVSDMEIYDGMTPERLAPALPRLYGADVVVLDGNLPAETITWLAARCPAPVAADTTSAAKAPRFLNALPRLALLKPNLLEARLLTGEESPENCARALLRAGVGRVVISLGPNGALAAEGAEMLCLPCPETVLVNATGGGDAMTAALALTLSEPLESSLRFALAAGAMAVESGETVNPEISKDAVLLRAGLL